MDLYLVRHGQPDWSPGRKARNDPHLTDVGREQASRVARRLVSLSRVDTLWVSPMNRALQTSQPIASGLGMEPEVHGWLQEINNPPEWEGSPADEIDRILAESNLRTIDEMWEGLPDGESFRSFHERVVSGLVGALETQGVRPMEPGHRHLWTVEDPYRRVVVVAHQGTNAVILGHLLGLDPLPWEWERFHQPHTGITRLTTVRISTGWAYSLRQLGAIDHLHPALVTM